MPKNLQYGLLTFPDDSEQANLGDDIQAIAAKKFLPRVDIFLNRENLHVYDGEPTLVIMNGWFMHKPRNFPPSDRIIPIFESFHIQQSIAEVFFTKNVLDYLQKHSPIGCRDMHTVNLLRSNGIDAYFSGCLTLTLDKEDFVIEPSGDAIVFSDLLFCYKKKLGGLLWQNFKHKLVELRCKKDKEKIIKALPTEMKNKSIFVTQFKGPTKMSSKARLQKANELLTVFANAKLVITSRLHTALPCVAFGTPVLLIDYKLDERFSGLNQFLNISSPQQLLSTIQSGKCEPDGQLMNLQKLTNKKNHLAVRQRLIENMKRKVDMIEKS